MPEVPSSPERGGLAPYAGIGRRLPAFLLDMCVGVLAPYALASFLWAPRGPGQEGGGDGVTGGLFFVSFLVLAPLGYFCLSYAWGKTPGMWALGLGVMDLSSGGRPGLGKAFLRAALLIVFVLAALILVAHGFGDRPNGLSAVDLAIVYLLLTVFVLSAAGHLWMVVDARRQSLQDKLLGLAVVRKANPRRRGWTGRRTVEGPGRA